MQIKRIAECSKGEHSAILLTFIKLPFAIKIFVLSIFEWPFYTGFTVIENYFSYFSTEAYIVGTLNETVLSTQNTCLNSSGTKHNFML